MTQISDLDRPGGELRFARGIIEAEAGALHSCAESLDFSFLRLVEMVYGCRGRLCLIGVGKSAAAAHKICGTLNSVGTATFVLDAVDAAHGDLGLLNPNDVVVFFSWSGETSELIYLAQHVKKLTRSSVLISRNTDSGLARLVDLVVPLGFDHEADKDLHIPTCSTVGMLALGDALAFCLARRRGFTVHDFRRYHPGGTLGKEIQ